MPILPKCSLKRFLTTLCLSLGMLPAAGAIGQCAWEAVGPPGTNNAVYSVTEWDPDGAGPLPASIVVGGNFPMAGGNSSIHQLAAFNGTSWSGFGSGFFAPGSTAAIYALVVMPNGDLVAGGDFQTANGVSAKYIARWTGSTWAPFSSGMNSPVRALAVTGQGTLIAAGEFTTAGGVPCNRVARWTGTAWLPLNTGSGGAGGVNGTVYALLALPSNDIIAAGEFFNANGLPVYSIAKWTALTGQWSGMGQGATPGIFGTVLALLRTTSGEIYAGGGFTIANGGPADNITRFDGTNWVSVGGGMDEAVITLCQRPSGDVIAGGAFSLAGGVPASKVAALHGGSWSAMANGGAGAGGMYVVPAAGSASVSALKTLNNGDLLAGGFFTTVGNPAGLGGVSANYVARWVCGPVCGSADFNGDGDTGTDADIEAFFACLAGNCCATCGSADFNGDGDIGTDADIESFFRVLGGGAC